MVKARWVLLVASLGLVACGTGGGEVPAWTEPSSYSYELTSYCGERALHGRFKITVTNGKVTDTEALDDPARTAIEATNPGFIPTLGELLEEARTAKANGADEVKVIVDETDGHPIEITLDPERSGIDDEACYKIPEFAPTG